MRAQCLVNQLRVMRQRWDLERHGGTGTAGSSRVGMVGSPRGAQHLGCWCNGKPQVCRITHFAARQIWLGVPALLVTTLVILAKVIDLSEGVRVLASFAEGLENSSESTYQCLANSSWSASATSCSGYCSPSREAGCGPHRRPGCPRVGTHLLEGNSEIQ